MKQHRLLGAHVNSSGSECGTSTNQKELELASQPPILVPSVCHFQVLLFMFCCIPHQSPSAGALVDLMVFLGRVPMSVLIHMYQCAHVKIPMTGMVSLCQCSSISGLMSFCQRPCQHPHASTLISCPPSQCPYVMLPYWYFVLGSISLY